jgi:prolyl 4-hydroxylase
MSPTAERLKRDGIVILRDFVAGQECKHILEELEFAYWAPSTVVQQIAVESLAIVRSARRGSETTSEEWFGPDLLRTVRRLEARLCRRLGLDRTHLEPWQATRYRRGGRFEAHFDSGPSFAGEPAGDRAVTLLVYVRAPEAGGSTTFPELALDVHGDAGTVIAWTNLTGDGDVDPLKTHSGRPVRKGSKVTLTTWCRQRPLRVPDY